MCKHISVKTNQKKQKKNYNLSKIALNIKATDCKMSIISYYFPLPLYSLLILAANAFLHTQYIFIFLSNCH